MRASVGVRHFRSAGHLPRVIGTQPLRTPSSCTLNARVRRCFPRSTALCPCLLRTDVRSRTHSAPSQLLQHLHQPHLGHVRPCVTAAARQRGRGGPGSDRSKGRLEININGQEYELSNTSIALLAASALGLALIVGTCIAVVLRGPSLRAALRPAETRLSSTAARKAPGFTKRRTGTSCCTLGHLITGAACSERLAGEFTTHALRAVPCTCLTQAPSSWVL